MLQHNIVSITFTEALKKVLSYKVQVRATTVWVVQVKQPIQLNSTFFFLLQRYAYIFVATQYNMSNITRENVWPQTFICNPPLRKYTRV